MDDLISRQAAIDEMEEYWRSLNLRRKRIHLAAEAVYMDLKGVVVTLPSAQPEQRWIPCSERYPDMDERVLVYTVAHEYYVWDCMSNRADNYFWEDEEGLYHDKYEADLWMPLPEPYKEEQK